MKKQEIHAEAIAANESEERWGRYRLALFARRGAHEARSSSETRDQISTLACSLEMLLGENVLYIFPILIHHHISNHENQAVYHHTTK